MIEQILRKFGFGDKEIRVYLTLLKIGSAPVRHIAQEAGINRTTTHDILGGLADEGLVSFMDKAKRRYFAAESPEHLLQVIKIREQKLVQLEHDVHGILPELKSVYEKSESKPKVKYFEGDAGIRAILQNVLDVAGRTQTKRYQVYSSSAIRKRLYAIFPDYNEQRIRRNVSVQSISIGAGGELHGMDERKWLTKEKGAPTYTLLYSGKIAHISLGENNELMGVVIEDVNTYRTTVMIFQSLWEKL